MADRYPLVAFTALTTSPLLSMTDIPFWMLIGLPGSGKSTWAEQFAAGRSPLRLVSTDRIRAHLYGDEAIQGHWLQIWQRVESQFAQGVAETRRAEADGILYDATNTRRRQRRDVLQTARAAGCTRLLAVWFDVPIAVCLQRNRQRSRQVPEEILHSMARQLASAPPHYDEGFDAVFRVGCHRR